MTDDVEVVARAIAEEHYDMDCWHVLPETKEDDWHSREHWRDIARAAMSADPRVSALEARIQELRRALYIAEPFLEPDMVRVGGGYGVHTRKDAIEIVRTALSRSRGAAS